MLISLAVTLFLAGLAASLWRLMRFESELRRAWASGSVKTVDRAKVGATLRRLIFSSLVSGVGIGLLGMSAFVWGRSSPPGIGAYVWAVLFILVAALGWPTIVVMAFMARINALEK